MSGSKCPPQMSGQGPGGRTIHVLGGIKSDSKGKCSIVNSISLQILFKYKFNLIS